VKESRREWDSRCEGVAAGVGVGSGSREWESGVGGGSGSRERESGVGVGSGSRDRLGVGNRVVFQKKVCLGTPLDPQGGGLPNPTESTMWGKGSSGRLLRRDERS